MALIHCDFFSDILGLSTSMYVILPQATYNQIGMDARTVGDKHPVLYLLHGLSDDHSIWLRRTSIERYASELGIAVVMPAGHRSFYTNMKNGYRYWNYISEEVPRIARSFFPLSDRREDNFVAGLSMGGYGAFKMALRRHDKFAAAASLSGVMDIDRILRESDGKNQELNNIFGSYEEFNKKQNDLFYIIANLKERQVEIPKLYQACGTEDFLYEDNRNFKKHCESLKVDLTYEEGPGDHTWEYWDEQIKKVLKWLPVQREKSSEPTSKNTDDIF